MTRRAPAPARNDDAVTVVIGVILLASLILSTFMTVRLYYVPIWEKDVEAARNALIERQALDFKGLVERQVDLRSVAPVTSAITAGTETRLPMGLSISAPTSRQISFIPNGNPVKVNITQLWTQVEEGDRFPGSPDENWIVIPGGEAQASNLTNDTRIASFRLRAEHIDQVLGEFIQLNLTDESGNKAGNFTFYYAEKVPDYTWNVRVCNKNGCNGNNVLYDQPILVTHASGHPTTLTVDVLNPDYRFDRLIANASRTATDANPAEVILWRPSEEVMNGNFSVDTLNQTGGGSTPGPEDFTLRTFDETFGGGQLVLESKNLRYPSTALIYDSGALVAEQPGEGSLFRVPPAFSVTKSGSQTIVSLNIPSLSGGLASTTLEGVITVRTTLVGDTQAIGRAANLTFNVTTPYPQLWESFFLDAFANAGLASDTYTLTNGTAGPTPWVRLFVEGTDASADQCATSDDVCDLTVNVRQGYVLTEIGVTSRG